MRSIRNSIGGPLTVLVTLDSLAYLAQIIETGTQKLLADTQGEQMSTVIGPRPFSIDTGLQSLTFLADRTPTTDSDEYVAELAPYRDGAMFVAHYAGTTEWECHTSGDEIVLVLEGHTTLILVIDDEDVRCELSTHECLVVPQGIWHRFETPDGVKVMSVTPQPTDHRVERP